jgi:hypothetical protein
MRGSAGREATRFKEHDSTSGEPGLVEECERNDGGLASAGRCHKDGAFAVRERVSERGQYGQDWEIG